MLIILLTFVVLIAAGTLFLLYRHFVTNRIMDGGRMENPDAQRDDKELVEFEWRQTRAEVERCFSLHFYLEDEEPLLAGWFTDAQSGEKRRFGTGASSDPSALTLTWVQWFELQHTLGMLELPEYSNPSPAETDFFTVTRMDAWGVSTWFMCTPEAAGKLIAMDYDNLAVKETTIVG